MRTLIEKYEQLTRQLDGQLRIYNVTREVKDWPQERGVQEANRLRYQISMMQKIAALKVSPH